VIAGVGSLLEAAALVAVWFFFARGPRGPRELLLAVAAAVIGFVAFGKVLSPQYMVWVAAAVPLALGRVRPFALAATLATLLLTLYIYDYGYFDMLRGGSVSWMMLARNVILVALFCSLLLELVARPRGRAVGPGHTRMTNGARLDAGPRWPARDVGPDLPQVESLASRLEEHRAPALSATVSVFGGWPAVLITVIVALIASSTVAVVLLTDLPLFLVSAVWIAPVVVFIPYAYPSAERRRYGAGTAAAALVLPAVATAWVLWLVLIHAH
jgi:hypothetical protein